MTDSEQLSRAEHMERRRGYVGASDAAAAIGLSPYRSPFDLYQDKLGVLPDQPSEPMIRGQILEPLVMRLYERAVGYELEPGGWLVSKEHDFMAASPDGIDTHENSPVQGKAISSWNRYEWGDPDSKVVPRHYFIQTQHEMSVLGVKRNRLAVLFADQETFRALVHMVKVGLDLNVICEFVEAQSEDPKSPVEFSRFPVDRDDSVIADIVEGERIFWFEHLKKKNPPPDEKIPETSKEIIEANDEEREAMQAFKDAGKEVKDAKQRYKEAGLPLKKIIGEKSGISDPDLGKVTYMSGTPTPDVDEAAILVAFEKKHPEQHAAAVERHRTIVNEEGLLAEFKILDPDGYAEALKENTHTVAKARSLHPYWKKAPKKK